MADKISSKTDVDIFKDQLKAYKQVIDADISAYSKHVQQATLQQYGVYARVECDAYLDILQRGGKRIRGALTMLGYEMSGGTDKAMILQAARAIEMIHAYILIIDDFQDRSTMRRGSKTAHVMLADYHRQHKLAGSAEHFGVSIAWNAALVGNHAAQMILANLNTDAELRMKVVSIVNRTMMITGHGQTNDIMNEVVAEVTEQDVERVMEWKTTIYTLLNPLHVGMVLAGADCHATDAITPYAHHAGKAFQITDDIIGTFGSEQELGKSPEDDMREGKRTLLTVYALKHANVADKNFLIQMLGKPDISPAEFERCKAILQESGALDYVKKQAIQQVEAALKSLEIKDAPWSPQGTKFLRGLAQYLLARQS